MGPKFVGHLNNLFSKENNENSFDNLYIQGVSHWNVSFKMPLTDRNMQVRFCLKLCVYSWGLEIWVSSTSFQKSNIGWPQQPPTEKVLKFNMIFHDSTKNFVFQTIKVKMNSRTWMTPFLTDILSVGGYWGQPILLFWKLVDETQISKPQEYTDTFKQNLTCIFLSVRGILKETFQCETPCT